MAIQSTFDLEPEEPRKRYMRIGRVTAIILIQKSSQIGPVVRALEQFSCMQSERQQTLGTVWMMLMWFSFKAAGNKDETTKYSSVPFMLD